MLGGAADQLPHLAEVSAVSLRSRDGPPVNGAAESSSTMLCAPPAPRIGELG